MFIVFFSVRWCLWNIQIKGKAKNILQMLQEELGWNSRDLGGQSVRWVFHDDVGFPQDDGTVG